MQNGIARTRRISPKSVHELAPLRAGHANLGEINQVALLVALVVTLLGEINQVTLLVVTLLVVTLLVALLVAQVALVVTLVLLVALVVNVRLGQTMAETLKCSIGARGSFDSTSLKFAASTGQVTTARATTTRSK